MANIVTNNFGIVGTASSDIIIVQPSAGAGANVITANDGNDVIFGDHDSTFNDLGSGNSNLASAINIDTATFWSTKPNPDVGNTLIPYTSVVAVGAGEFDYFSVSVGAGQTITIDVDYAAGGLGGPSFDSQISLHDFTGATLATNDDAAISLGGRGSTSILDSYLSFTASVTTLYYIRVAQFNNTPVPANSTYMLNVSVTGHTNTNIADFGDDTIDGGAGSDVIYGLDGNDELIGGAGNDTVLGGNGNDDMFAGAGIDSLNGEAGNDTLQGGDGTDTLIGGSGNDSIHGYFFGFLPGFTSEADFLLGQDGNDTLDGGGGNDTLLGGTGDDLIFDEFGIDLLDGGSGNDTVDFSLMTFATGTILSLPAGQVIHHVSTELMLNFENVFGSNGSEIINGSAGANDLRGNLGNDTIRAGAGNDTVRGGGGDDSILGGTGNDVLNGNSGDDTIDGQAGGDTINGGAGNDSLLGSFQSDLILGGDGHDFIDCGALEDAGDGGNGNDTINGVTGDDLLLGRDDHDVLRGGKGIDTLFGGSGNDLLAGGDHSDSISGGPGADTLWGQFGLDTLGGGGGADVLIGGAHADTFVFANGYGPDTINDFANDQDTLVLNDGLWGGAAMTAQQVVNTFASVVGSHTVFDFAGFNDLTVKGITNPNLLVDDIIIV